MIKIIERSVCILGLILLVFTSIATGQGSKFSASLSGKDTVPAVNTPAHGQATLQLSKDDKSLSYRLSVMDIENVSMAHIHLGPAGQEGPVVVWLYPSKPPAVVKQGEFSGVLARGSITAASLTGPLKGKTIADLMEQIKAGKAYVNVHTEKHPAGEIRGQIE